MMVDYELLLRSGRASVGGTHLLAVDPREADVILFVGTRDSLQRDVWRHELYRSFPEKAVVYDSRDCVIPTVRGIFPSIERRFHRPWRTCSGFYLRWLDAQSIEFTDPATTPRYLFGFTGASVTHPIRSEVLSLRDSDALMRDTTSAPGRGFGKAPGVYADYKADYGADLASVRFVLCPRGVGTSSMRIFEAMRAGRVPVVISDDWVEPPGPNWAAFSLRVSESSVAEVPERLRRLAHAAAEMGRASREAWEQWFSPEACFQTLAGMAANLQAGSWARERLARRMAYLQLFRPRFFRGRVRNLTGARSALASATRD